MQQDPDRRTSSTVPFAGYIRHFGAVYLDGATFTQARNFCRSGYDPTQLDGIINQLREHTVSNSPVPTTVQGDVFGVVVDAGIDAGVQRKYRHPSNASS